MMFSPTVINVLGFKVNSMDRMAIVSLGPLQQNDIFESNKRNQGFGEQNGDLNVINLPLNYVMDSDLLDSGSQKGSIV